MPRGRNAKGKKKKTGTNTKKANSNGSRRDAFHGGKMSKTKLKAAWAAEVAAASSSEYTYPDGGKYVGQWKNGKREGKGAASSHKAAVNKKKPKLTVKQQLINMGVTDTRTGNIRRILQDFFEESDITGSQPVLMTRLLKVLKSIHDLLPKIGISLLDEESASSISYAPPLILKERLCKYLSDNHQVSSGPIDTLIETATTIGCAF